uniref:Ig-like domain-containing protein n=1 Tax=Apteryx owenii TaxID=8824 RepID=A0A8B9P8T5_APTOW
MCVASNVHGETACSAHLCVRHQIPGAPRFAKTPNSVQCALGLTAVFEYTVAGEPYPDVQWFKGSERLFSDARHSVVHRPDGSGSLTVQECMEEDGGIYTCRVLSALGEAVCSAELLVLPEDHLTKKDTVLGSSIRMECKVSGSLPVTAKWFKDGKEITDSAKCRSLCHENTMSLEIANLELADTANYTCSVSNVAGSDSWTEVTLECEISGTPPFDVTWYKDRRQIRSSKKYKVTAKNYHTSVHILNVEAADVGEYQCKAQNDIGSDTCICTLTSSHKYRITFLNKVSTLKIMDAEKEDSGLYTFAVQNDVGKSSCTASVDVLGWLGSLSSIFYQNFLLAIFSFLSSNLSLFFSLTVNILYFLVQIESFLLLSQEN